MQTRSITFQLLLTAGLLLGSGEQLVSLLRADDAKKSAAATPSPKFDKDGKTPQPGFAKAHESYVEIAKKGDVEVLFLGDSITAGWRGAGKDVWAKHFEPLKAANFGIGGDRTQHVLWRILNGELDGIKPKIAVLMIGTNNSGADSATDIAEGVTEIVKTIHKKSPSTKVLLLAVFPRGKMLPNSQNDKLIEVNKTLAKLDDGGKTVRFLDIGPKFLGEDKQLPKDIMPDFLHLSPKGYEIWAEAIMPALKEMVGK
ncbi:MAG: GDSL family lipase [Planctomycetia bacterium]|nr:GDSL family lipase [Planctomycetia bacterium]